MQLYLQLHNHRNYVKNISIRVCIPKYTHNYKYLLPIKSRNQDIILNIKLNYKIKFAKILLLTSYHQFYKASNKNYYQDMDLLFIDEYCDIHFIFNK